mgnify:CR=1 FL=1
MAVARACQDHRRGAECVGILVLERAARGAEVSHQAWTPEGDGEHRGGRFRLVERHHLHSVSIVERRYLW